MQNGKKKLPPAGCPVAVFAEVDALPGAEDVAGHIVTTLHGVEIEAAAFVFYSALSSHFEGGIGASSTCANRFEDVYSQYHGNVTI